MSQARRVLVRAGVISAISCAVAASGAPAGEKRSVLELREIRDGRLAETGNRITGDAVRVFVYEGEPRSVRVTEGRIAVSYGDHAHDGNSGVVFDRATGNPVRRLTVAEGWPKERPGFAPPRRRWSWRKLVGPGVADHFWDRERRGGRGGDATETQAVTSAEFQGATFRAMQVPVESVFRGIDWRTRRERFGSWTSILGRVHGAGYVEETAPDGKTTRFTARHGLAGNIVSRLVVAQGSLWAACVDIYDPKTKQWDFGGLCRFDPERSRWEHIKKIEGRPVRWVTLLQAVGDELWVGFRVGEGVAGDRVIYGMGLYPGEYRPKATALVLARLKGGEWRSWSRDLLPESAPRRAPRGEKMERPPPTEKPWRLARSGSRVILFSQVPRRAAGSWHVDTSGRVSLVDLETGRWRHFRTREDFGAHWLQDIVAENGEIIVTSDRGAHRWDARSESWRFLETGCPLRNPMLSAATPVGDELWIGYTNQGFGFVGEQGISRYDEVAGVWTYVAPDEIGTTCPVRKIIARSPSDVWLLFQQRPWHGAAREPIRVPEQSRGMGRFRDAKWEFPAKLNGVPDFIEHERKGPNGIERWKQPLSIEHLVAIGDKLFVATGRGVYAGLGFLSDTGEAGRKLPVEWKEIATGDWIRSISKSDDGKALVILREQRGRRSRVVQKGRYDFAMGKLDFRNVKPGSGEMAVFSRTGDLLEFAHNERWTVEWVRIPTAREGEWAVGPLGCYPHRVVETKHAIWIATRGELIRLDRGKLSEWIGK